MAALTTNVSINCNNNYNNNFFLFINVCLLSQALQQEKHVLQRRLEMSELVSGQRESELTNDLATLRAELERNHSRGRDRRKDESDQLTQLANHNQRLVEQLAEVTSTSQCCVVCLLICNNCPMACTLSNMFHFMECTEGMPGDVKG